MQVCKLGLVIDQYIRLVRMQCEIILVIGFGRIEVVQRDDLRHDGYRKSVGVTWLLYKPASFAAARHCCKKSPSGTGSRYPDPADSAR